MIATARKDHKTGSQVGESGSGMGPQVVRACELCDGSGMEVREENGVRVAGQCKCTLDAAMTKRMARAGVPPRYQNATLDSFRTEGSDASISRAVMRIRHAIEDASALSDGRGFLLSGNCGTGKTHLAVVTLREAMTRLGSTGRFWNTGKLLSELRFSFNRDSAAETERGLRRELESVDVLVLDDLGAERGTDWAADQVSQIINDRYDAGKTTHITTNYANLAPGAGGDYHGETLGDRIGARMWSRLQEMCITIEMNGQDYRLRGRGR